MSLEQQKTNADILIIGGGVIGTCTALFLTRAGRQVTLVEKADICAGASHGNACWVATGYAIPTAAPGVLGQGLKWLLDSGSPFYIKPRLSLDLARWLWAFQAACTHSKMMAGAEILMDLNRQSLHMFRELATEFEFGYQERGLLHLHLSEKYRQAGEKEAELLRSMGIKAISLDRDGLEELEPSLEAGINSGVFFPEHANLEPRTLVETVAAQAEKEGATILTQTEVTGVERDGNRITAVETSNGTMIPNEVVLAAGAWSSIVAKKVGAPILMEPAKGYSMTVKRRSETQGPSRPISVDDSKVAITPLGREHFRFSSTLELSGFDLSINQKRLAVNRQTLQTVLPDMDNLDVEETWAGYRPMTPDGLPYIGRSERVDNLIFATGHGMLGITHGPLTGKLVTEILTGQEPSVKLEPMRPERY
ncbi:MAG: FAD-dependent oxidoreductase [Chloroflexota bacterium]